MDKLYFARTKSGQDVVGQMNVEKEKLMDVFKIQDEITQTGLKPILLPIRSLLFSARKDKSRVKFNLLIKNLTNLLQVDKHECISEDLIKHLKASYKIMMEHDVFEIIDSDDI